MANKPRTTAEYIAALPERQRTTLTALGDAIRAAAPGAEEAFSYAMPALTLDGKGLLWFAAWKRHYSLYPIGAALVKAHAAEVDGYKIGRATIQFPADKPIPYDLVAALVKSRVAELRERGK